MSNKSFFKFVVAFVLLAGVLIFLGVNYVPRISALSSTNEGAVNPAIHAGSDYIERHPFNYSIDAKTDIGAGSDWIPYADILRDQANEKASEVDHSGTDWIPYADILRD